jgi:hypothetical protein
VEDKIISNLLQGFPFSFPFWRGPMDQVLTLENAVAHEDWTHIKGCQDLTKEQMQQLLDNVNVLFAIYASGKKKHPRWTEAKHAVRAFPYSYKVTMGITSPMKNWIPKLV